MVNNLILTMCIEWHLDTVHPEWQTFVTLGQAVLPSRGAVRVLGGWHRGGARTLLATAEEWQEWGWKYSFKHSHLFHDHNSLFLS